MTDDPTPEARLVAALRRNELAGALRAALPRAVNFRIPLALPVRSAVWDTIASELATAVVDDRPRAIGIDDAWARIEANPTWEVAEVRQRNRGDWQATAWRRETPRFDVFPWFVDGHGDSPIAALRDLSKALAGR